MAKHYLEVQIVWHNNQSISRFVIIEDEQVLSVEHQFLFTTLSAVHECIAHSKISTVLKFEVKSITVKLVSEADLLSSHAIRFSNICGRIKHSAAYHNEWSLSDDRSWTVYKDNIKGALQPVVNAFGRSVNLYAMTVNYSTSDKQQFTLFKGGIETLKIRNEIDLVMKADAVERISVHMVVATAKMNHYVSSDAFFLDKFWKTSTEMKCVTVVAENESSKRLRLEDFGADFYLRHRIVSEIRLKNVLITIGYRGNVNIFYTFLSEVDINCNIENSLLPFSNYLIQTINDFT